MKLLATMYKCQTFAVLSTPQELTPTWRRSHDPGHMTLTTVNLFFCSLTTKLLPPWLPMKDISDLLCVFHMRNNTRMNKYYIHDTLNLHCSMDYFNIIRWYSIMAPSHQSSMEVSYVIIPNSGQKISPLRIYRSLSMMNWTKMSLLHSLSC